MPSNERPGICWLKSSRDIKSLRRAGKFSRCDLLLVWVSPNACEGAEVPIVGVVTGKGFHGAVQRNRAKRRVRGCIMDLRHLLKPGLRYLVECRPGVEGTDYQYLVNELRVILSRSLN